MAIMAPKPKPDRKPNKRLISLRGTLGLTQAGMADKLGVAFRSYQYYEASAPIPKPVKILISLIEAGKY